MQPPKTTHNHPKPPTTINNHPQPPTPTQKVKTCHKHLLSLYHKHYNIIYLILTQMEQQNTK